jgi:hypothetical protein
LTDSEKLELYRKNCTFDQLAMMHIEAMRHIDRLTVIAKPYFMDTKPAPAPKRRLSEAIAELPEHVGYCACLSNIKAVLARYGVDDKEIDHA